MSGIGFLHSIHTQGTDGIGKFGAGRHAELHWIIERDERVAEKGAIVP
jgi:hypothetical protein